MSLQKSVKERFFHALGFEVLAIAICAPLGAWLLDYSLAHMGLLTLMISLIAMSWNMLFNALFDRAQRRMGFRRTLVARAVHSVLFEIGLLPNREASEDFFRKLQERGCVRHDDLLLSTQTAERRHVEIVSNL